MTDVPGKAATPPLSVAPVTSLADSVVQDGNTLYCSLPLSGERRSVGGLLQANARRFPGHPVYLEKAQGRYQPVSWEEFAQRVATVASFLSFHGIGSGDRVAVVSRNRGEMLLTELAVMSLGAIYVPIFAGYTGPTLLELLDHCGAEALFVSGEDQLQKLAGLVRPRLVVSYDPLPPERLDGLLPMVTGARESLPEILLRHAVNGVSEQDAFLRAAAAVDPATPCLMMYTSGTSGRQKGVLLTHDNILSQQRAMAAIWTLTPADRVLSYLPWHHSFGGIFEKYLALSNAAPLALDESHGKDFPILLANFKTIRPTVYFSVPMLHQALVNHVRTHSEDEPEVFHPELRFVFTAAAPLPANISEYFASKGIPVVEGWGLTETAPCCTVTDMHRPRSVPGMVGHPIPGVKLSIAEDGEILVQGPNVMLGYHASPEATGRALPGDGWFHTGDLGEIVDRGLKLLTRKDRVFKMLNAEKVVPTVLENRLAGLSHYIRHALVVGSGQGFLAALIFPDLALIGEELGADREAAEQVVTESFRQAILELNRTNPVKYEHLQAFAVVSRELSVDAGELTPSLKVRVQNVLRGSQRYITAIFDPTEDCDCRFLQKILRMAPDGRPCIRGKAVTLDRCHECGPSVLDAVEP
jgi:long-subunit acyl-CoA synthetase (AMP-forming)